jgi:pimeloyl-ACP methyl ester carboxylesterase
MTHLHRGINRLAAVAALATVGHAAAQESVVRFAGATCNAPPVLHCPDTACSADRVINPGPVVEMASRRTYFLDYPCDLKPGEEVTVVLSLHGGGSYANWQRHYFPMLDYKDQYRLVIATPSSPTRVWTEADDQYLHDIVESAIEQIGAANVRAFWLVGHSQGGATSRRLACTEFFKGKVDGFLSLSGGRIGGNPGRADFGFRPPATPSAAAGAGGAGAVTSIAQASSELPSCDFSHIYATGERELDENGLPETSEWAAKFACGPRGAARAVVDAKAGYVYDSTRQNPPNPAWGLTPSPGSAQISVYPDCTDGRVVADAVRIDKGHTEGLEPAITQELVKLMVSAPGGKIQRGR